MKPQPKDHALDKTYKEEIKPDVILDNKSRSPSQYQDGDNMTYSEKEALKQLPEVSSWPKFSGTGRNEGNLWKKELAMVEESNNPKVQKWYLNMAKNHVF
ncbi:hypothetical protein O181_004052 [Austropuccinia psidii MF-1]|uniref:Uncharacterized protein n=1 Tax=Austropuccinia psidii MF-1 TaxID=1389203 RepID=A0A9Q3GFF1_9BASI|nr:hypothetical protein [Austropuccinia psidii MF-1]